MTKIKDPNIQDLLKKRYYQNNENSWDELCTRVANNIASCEKDKEKWFDEFFNILSSRDFISSTPSLINANMPAQQLSSCFVLPIEEDSLEGIFKTITQSAKVFQRNGGVGFSASILRPQNANVISSTGKSCGIVGFLEIFDKTGTIITENNVRKCAIKCDLDIWHPDIPRFISCKDNTDKLNKMNISVMVNDDFMKAVQNDEMWQLRFPDYENCKELYDKEWNGFLDEWEGKGYPVKIYKEISAKKLYYKIMKHAWLTGEPGISFKDHMEKENPNPHLGRISATNPLNECGFKILSN